MTEPAPKSEVAQKPEEADAAIEEVEDSVVPKTVTIRDTEFTIPDKQPAELLFAARAASRAARTKNEAGAMEAMIDMAVAYIGEDNLRGLMQGVSVEEGAELIQSLLDQASEAYGNDQGE